MTSAVLSATPAAPPPQPQGTPQPEDGEMLYAALQHAGYRLRHPVKLRLAVESGAAVVQWDAGQIRVTGATLGEALGALRSSIIAQASSLSEFVYTVG